MGIIKEYFENWKKLGANNAMTLQLEKGSGFEPDKDAVRLVYDYQGLLPSINQKECFRNALLATLVHDELEYWQGYYVTEGIPLPLEHAFNVKDGKVVDFTSVKFNISVVEYWGVKIPREVLQEYQKTEQYFTALEYYFREIYKKD